jgi:hypothetical protein
MPNGYRERRDAKKRNIRRLATFGMNLEICCAGQYSGNCRLMQQGKDPALLPERGGKISAGKGV